MLIGFLAIRYRKLWDIKHGNEEEIIMLMLFVAFDEVDDVCPFLVGIYASSAVFFGRRWLISRLFEPLYSLYSSRILRSDSDTQDIGMSH